MKNKNFIIALFKNAIWKETIRNHALYDIANPDYQKSMHLFNKTDFNEQSYSFEYHQMLLMSISTWNEALGEDRNKKETPFAKLAKDVQNGQESAQQNLGGHEPNYQSHSNRTPQNDPYSQTPQPDDNDMDMDPIDYYFG